MMAWLAGMSCTPGGLCIDNTQFIHFGYLFLFAPLLLAVQMLSCDDDDRTICALAMLSAGAFADEVAALGVMGPAPCWLSLAIDLPPLFWFVTREDFSRRLFGLTYLPGIVIFALEGTQVCPDRFVWWLRWAAADYLQLAALLIWAIVARACRPPPAKSCTGKAQSAPLPVPGFRLSER